MITATGYWSIADASSVPVVVSGQLYANARGTTWAQDVDCEVIVGLQAETSCMEAQWLMPDNISPVLQ